MAQNRPSRMWLTFQKAGGFRDCQRIPNKALQAAFGALRLSRIYRGNENTAGVAAVSFRSVHVRRTNADFLVMG